MMFSSQMFDNFRKEDYRNNENLSSTLNSVIKQCRCNRTYRWDENFYKMTETIFKDNLAQIWKRSAATIKVKLRQNQVYL